MSLASVPVEHKGCADGAGWGLGNKAFAKTSIKTKIQKYPTILKIILKGKIHNYQIKSNQTPLLAVKQGLYNLGNIWES